MLLALVIAVVCACSRNHIVPSFVSILVSRNLTSLPYYKFTGFCYSVAFELQEINTGMQCFNV